MVHSSSLAAICFTLICTLIAPLVVSIIYAVKNKGQKIASALLLGGAGFFIMQMLVRLPLMSVLSFIPAFTEFSNNHYLLYCLILAMTAALFELIGRLVVARILSKELTYKRSFAAGLGHGGIESIFIVGIAYINNLLYALMINQGAFDAIVEQTAATGVDTSQLTAVKDALIQTAPQLYLLAAYERILTIITHIALSMLVCYFVAKKDTWKGLGLCFLIHTLIDFVAPVFNGLATSYLGNRISATTSYVLIYGFLTLVAVLSIFIIYKLKKIWSQPETESVS